MTPDLSFAAYTRLDQRVCRPAFAFPSCTQTFKRDLEFNLTHRPRGWAIFKCEKVGDFEVQNDTQRMAQLYLQKVPTFLRRRVKYSL
jgi:hypothetical protein